MRPLLLVAFGAVGGIVGGVGLCALAAMLVWRRVAEAAGWL